MHAFMCQCKAAAGCIMCMLHPRAGVWHLPALAAAGVGCFRVELVDEPAGQVTQILEAYRSAQRAASSVWAQCICMAQCICTDGCMTM